MERYRAWVVVTGMALAVASGCKGGDDNMVVCSPGETRACVGPAACEGAQFCSSDGLGWSDCDCGEVTGDGGSAGDTSEIGGADEGGSGGSTGGTLSTSGGDSPSGEAGTPGAGGSDTGGAPASGGSAGASSDDGGAEVGGSAGSGGETAPTTGGVSTGGVAVAGVSTAAEAGTPGLGGGYTSGGTAGSGGTSSDGGAGGFAGAAGNAGSGGDDGCFEGPGNACWSIGKGSEDASIEWITSPTLDAVGAFGQSAADGTVWMSAELDPEQGLDLSVYDRLWFDATIPVGMEIGVGVANGTTAGCSWKVTGVGTTRYAIDLTQPAHQCWPTPCDFDRRRAGAISFGSLQWGTEFFLSIEVTDFGFETAAAEVNPLSSAENAGIGLNDWCWSLFTFADTATGSSSEWLAEPEPGIAHFHAVDFSATSTTGAMAYLPETLRDLSRFSLIEIDAEVITSDATHWHAQIDDANGEFCSYEPLVVQSQNLYTLQLDYPGYCSVGFDITAARAFYISSSWDLAGDYVFSVTGVSFQ